VQVLKCKVHKDFNGVRLWKPMFSWPVPLIERWFINTKRVLQLETLSSSQKSVRRLKITEQNKERKWALKAQKLPLRSWSKLKQISKIVEQKQ
jgi:hypothetical protein